MWRVSSGAILNLDDMWGTVSLSKPARNASRQANAASLASVERALALLALETADNGTAISAHLQGRYAELAAALSTVPGVGQTSIAVLIADLPELGKIDRATGAGSLP